MLSVCGHADSVTYIHTYVHTFLQLNKSHLNIYLRSLQIHNLQWNSQHKHSHIHTYMHANTHTYVYYILLLLYQTHAMQALSGETSKTQPKTEPKLAQISGFRFRLALENHTHTHTHTPILGSHLTRQNFIRAA